MIFRLAWRSLAARPIRSAVLAGGFGLGVAVMAALLGIGGAILEQARVPALVGGGDVAIVGASGRIPNARFVLSSVLGSAPLDARIAVAAPTLESPLYLIEGDGTATPIRATGGIPSLERRLGEPEIRRAGDWRDTPADRAWASPDPGALLREIDRFHAVPDVPARADSWAEWLYFNGRTADARFYLTFLAGPSRASGEREMGVRLQLERAGRMTSYADRATVNAASLLENAPDLTVGRSRVRLVGTDYHITLDLPAEAGRARASGEIVVHATPGRSLPPLSIRGAGGWVSGYVVPVMSGTLDGSLQVGTETIALTGGAAYHDHNWGFWDGVSWQWGQVQGGGLSFVYGRVHPPADAADPARIPGFLAAIGPQGLVGYATDVRIDEINDPATGRPRRIVVRGEGTSLALTFDLAVTQTTVTARQASVASALDFLQLRGTCHVEGQAGGRPVNFTAAASAETFRGRRERSSH
ncbi:MAG TPA: hypothetical protein VFX12_02415 [Vicinamibacterales bacterium]|nr:hypothetical protein [Vicinamibacterales bacterium]